jgi:hypothetical protein
MAELLTKADLADLRADLADLKADLAGLKPDLASLAPELETLFERQTRQLTVRFAIMLAVGFGGLAAFLKLT